jgi:hypothetical protein
MIYSGWREEEFESEAEKKGKWKETENKRITGK